MIDAKLIPSNFGSARYLSNQVNGLHELELELRKRESDYLVWKGQVIEDASLLAEKPCDAFPTIGEYMQHQANLLQRRKLQQGRRCNIQGTLLGMEQALETFIAARQDVLRLIGVLRKELAQTDQDDLQTRSAMFNAVQAERIYKDAGRVIEETRREIANEPTRGNGIVGLKGEFADTARVFAIKVNTSASQYPVFEQTGSDIPPKEPLCTFEEAVEQARRWESKTGSKALICNLHSNEIIRL